MTNEEKRKLAVERELAELARIADGFAHLAHEARKQADELALWALRMDKLRREQELDEKIADLEELAAYRLFLRAQHELDLDDPNSSTAAHSRMFKRLRLVD